MELIRRKLSIFMLVIVAISVLLIVPSLVFRCGFTAKLQHPDDLHFQEIEMTLTIASTWRRMLSGPGSSPPRCAWKCGHCTPCKAIHVSVPPGFRVTTEYYPEAWRCKCRNELYMP